MRVNFKYIGLFILMIFSFYFTNKVYELALDTDIIMKEIKNNEDKFNKEPINAKIDNDKIKPGSCGYKVDKKKSYNKMKKIGIYNENYYLFKNILPVENINNNKNKYIIGDNTEKNNVYLFLNINEDNYMYLNESYKNYNIVITYNFYKEHKEILDKIIKNNTILIRETNHQNLKEINKYYTKYKESNITCVNSNNKTFLNLCSLNNSLTISLNNEINNNYLLNIKKEIISGRFININFTKSFNNIKDIIDNQIENKGLHKGLIDNDIREC